LRREPWGGIYVEKEKVRKKCEEGRKVSSNLALLEKKSSGKEPVQPIQSLGMTDQVNRFRSSVAANIKKRRVSERVCLGLTRSGDS